MQNLSLKLQFFLILLFSVFLSACDPEIHVYSRSLAQSWPEPVDVLDPSILIGSYQITESPNLLSGTAKVQPKGCWSLSKNLQMDINADCLADLKTSDDILKITHLLLIEKRLFLEIKVRPSPWSVAQFGLIEILFTKAGLQFRSLEFDKGRVLHSNLDFKRTTIGGYVSPIRELYEARNNAGDTYELIHSMRPAKDSFKNLTVRSLDAEHSEKLRQWAVKHGLVLAASNLHKHCQEFLNPER